MHSKGRKRLLKYCVGLGLDLGCGKDKINANAIGVDLEHGDIALDLRSGLTNIFQPNTFNYVFCGSGLLGKVQIPEAMLKDWWTVLEPGGYLVLHGSPDVTGWLREFADFEIERDHTESGLTEFVARKTAPILSVAKPKPEKTACILRFGAIGDHIIATSCLPHLKADGYHVTYYTSPAGVDVLANNPHIDELLLWEHDSIPDDQLEGFYETISEQYDKTIVLNGSVEGALSLRPDDARYWEMSHEERRQAVAGKNFYRHTCQIAGYKVENPRGELYPSEMEKAVSELFRAKLGKVFKVLWCLSGSGPDKVYPYHDMVIMHLLEEHKDANDIVFITVGDKACQEIEFDHPKWLKRSGVWGIRQSLLACGDVDLVISPDTSILNAAGCFDTPKIGLLTHASVEMVTGTFTNNHSMQADIECSPCHRIMYPETAVHCPRFTFPDGTETNLCACAGAIDPVKLNDNIEQIYWKWRSDNKPRIILAGHGLGIDHLLRTA